MGLRLDKSVLVVNIVVIVTIVVVCVIEIPQSSSTDWRASLLVLYLLLDPRRSSLFPYIVWWRLTW